MATLEQIEQALRAADAAGNVEDARRLAQAYAEMRTKPKADFSGVVGQAHTAPNPTDDMGGMDRFAAGVGKAVADTGRGLRQAGQEFATLIAPGYAKPAMQARADELRADTDEVRARDAALMDTGAGLSGNVLGTAGTLLAPGGAAIRYAPKAAALRSMLLPTSVRGAAAQGGVVGAIQQAGEGESRAAQAGLGALLGGAGGAIAPALGGLYRLLRGQNPAASGIERRVVETLRENAQRPAQLMQEAPSQIPGVQRTLAEETLDPGIAGLERWARSRAPGAFDPMDRVNNAARVQAMRQIAGEEGDIAAAEIARDEQTAGLLQRAMRPAQVDVSPVQQAISGALSASAGRPTVQAAVRDVERAIADAGTDPAGLYNVRKYIGDLLEGKAGSDKGYARAASRELIELRNALDEQISAVSPDFGRYLSAYREGSKPINRMQIGQQLVGQRSGSAIVDAVTGEQVLTPAAFSRQARDLDRVAQQATGFNKARAADYLTPEDLATIGAVQDDLGRRAFVATSPAANSNTFEKLATNERIAGGMASRIPLVGPAIGYLREFGQQRLEQKLVEVLANPAQARAILAKLPANDRRIIETALSRIGGGAGAMSPALAE